MNKIYNPNYKIKPIIFACTMMLSMYTWSISMTLCTDTSQDSANLLNEVVQDMGKNQNKSYISWNIGQSNNQVVNDERFFFSQLPDVGTCKNITFNLSKSTSKEDEQIELDKLIKEGGLKLSLRDYRDEGKISDKDIVLPYTTKFMLNYCRMYIHYTYISTSKLISNILFEVWEHSGNFNNIEVTPQCCLSPSPIPVSKWGIAPENFRGGQDCPIKKPI